MLDASQHEGGGSDPSPFKFALVPTHKPEQLLEHVRSAASRGLPMVTECESHEEILSIAGGGPSLEDTYKELQGYVATANGSLRWLLEKGVIPQMCGVCDPSAHIVDLIEPHKDVSYFLASCVHPSVFDKLKDCRVYLWHLHPIEGLDTLLDVLYPDGWVQHTGGCTMGLRWLNLGYFMGFRAFHFHGLDSSFRGKATHAYPDHQDHKEWLNFDGYQTRPNFIGQVVDFIQLMESLKKPPCDPVDIEMFGDGLLQKRYRDWLKG